MGHCKGQIVRYVSAVAVAILATCAPAVAAQLEGELAGRVAFADPQSPPPWIEVHPAAKRDFDLGFAIFSSEWSPAGAVEPAARNRGLGPLFVENSCTACHAAGARGRPAMRPDEVSHSFVMQLGGAPTGYGHVLNTRATPGFVPEGRIAISIAERSGRYPDGRRWSLRVPRYTIVDLADAPLPAGTVLRPRIAPPLFGVGLLDAVAQSAVDGIRARQPRAVRGTPGGRFGWQGDAASLVDQTAIAFAREMGLTSELQAQDDCTALQTSCRDAPQPGSPELPERLFHAVNTFQFLLAAPARGQIDPVAEARGGRLFEQAGCAACHVPELPVPRDSGAIRIDPHSDLLLHDMGGALADRDLAGRIVASRWRTAPLWGLSHALAAGPVALLHDGRARSIEEAVLWHEGQAAGARRRFMALDAASRQQLLDWVGSL